MNDLIPPAAGVQPDRRQSERRAGDRRTADRRSAGARQAAGGKNLPAVMATSAGATDPPQSRVDATAAAFTAQLIGQSGQKRGLKGGPPVLDAARATYLSTEWSGPHDRRVRAGRIARTDV